MGKKYDCIIIGGGPAGLSAAIYLGRFTRSVLVLDKRDGRSSYPQINENYLGFPDGIHAQDLCKLGTKQAQRFGVQFKDEKVEDVSGKTGNFAIRTDGAHYKAKTIILATGVTDVFPVFENFTDYIGISLFWCITCDGFKTKNRKVVVVGNSEDAATTCMQFLLYTKKLTLLSNSVPGSSLSAKTLKQLETHKIPFIEACITNVLGENGYVKKIKLDNGKSLSADFIFSSLGSHPNSSLAQKLDLNLSHNGYIVVDTEQRTNIAGVYAAGDVTRLHSHQIVTAAHEGSMAAQSANYDLYQPFQKSE